MRSDMPGGYSSHKMAPEPRLKIFCKRGQFRPELPMMFCTRRDTTLQLVVQWEKSTRTLWVVGTWEPEGNWCDLDIDTLGWPFGKGSG